MKRFSIAAAASALMLGIAAPASAALITGLINFSGAAIFDTKNKFGSAVLDFSPGGTGVGGIVTIDAVTEYFAGLGITGIPPGTDGIDAQIMDQTNDPLFAGIYPAGPRYIPVDTPLVLEGDRFIDKFKDNIAPFTMVPNDLHFNLTYFPSQGGVACTAAGIADGTSCSIGAFLLEQTALGVRLSWDYIGEWVNGVDEGDYIGAFSAALVGYTVAEVISRIDNGLDIACGVGRDQECGIVGNFEPLAAVPEPATLLLFGAGSGLLALRRRKAAGL